ncbi:MAG: polymer-forming cytoskeletal protein [Ruminococcaceae bacterium]|nr:polymer-forming cytoskeletal protein [Oscillospiraceae bacterium]
MNMKISGAGQIPAGEYEDIRISGSASLHGLIRCKSYHVSGASRGDGLDCENECKISGSSRFTGTIKAGSLTVSGAFHCNDNLEVSGKLICSGSVQCGGNLRAAEISASGGLTCKGGIEAELVRASGKLNCGGLLNAEEIDIEYTNGIDIESIGGSKIAVYKARGIKKVNRLPLLSKLINGDNSLARIGSVEGDTIALEGVMAQSVCGRVVAIGEDCDIALVQYSEQVEVSPRAKVGAIEKI